MLEAEKDLEQAVAKAIEHCKAHGIMADYLNGREKEVTSMLIMQYQAEWEREALHELGRAEGLKEGLDKKARAAVKNLLTMGLSMKEIARVAGWTEEDVRKFAEAEKIS